MIAYAQFEVSLHGLGIEGEDEFRRFRADLARHIEHVAARYTDPRRPRLAGDVEVTLLETAGKA